MQDSRSQEENILPYMVREADVYPILTDMLHTALGIMKKPRDALRDVPKDILMRMPKDTRNSGVFGTVVAVFLNNAIHDMFEDIGNDVNLGAKLNEREDLRLERSVWRKYAEKNISVVNKREDGTQEVDHETQGAFVDIVEYMLQRSFLISRERQDFWKKNPKQNPDYEVFPRLLDAIVGYHLPDGSEEKISGWVLLEEMTGVCTIAAEAMKQQGKELRFDLLSIPQLALDLSCLPYVSKDEAKDKLWEMLTHKQALFDELLDMQKSVPAAELGGVQYSAEQMQEYFEDMRYRFMEMLGKLNYLAQNQGLVPLAPTTKVMNDGTVLIHEPLFERANDNDRGEAPSF